jgi:hypothetical protein
MLHVGQTTRAYINYLKNSLETLFEYICTWHDQLCDFPGIMDNADVIDDNAVLLQGIR